jgi:hypothetical protein
LEFFYGLAQLRALGVPFWMLLLGVSQEVAKKETQAFPLGTPSIRRLNSRRRAFCLAKFLHLRGIYRTPQMGLLLARAFAIPFSFEIFANSGA